MPLARRVIEAADGSVGLSGYPGHGDKCFILVAREPEFAVCGGKPDVTGLVPDPRVYQLMKRDTVKFLREQALNINVPASLDQPRCSVCGKHGQQVHIGRSAPKIVVHREYLDPPRLLAGLSHSENQIPAKPAPSKKPSAKCSLQTLLNGPGTNVRLD